jgi:hypothetical protein
MAEFPVGSSLLIISREEPYRQFARQRMNRSLAHLGVPQYTGSFDGQPMSGVIEFHTQTHPRITFTDQHPRVAATPENLAELRVRYDANDTRTHFWVDLLRDRVLRAAEAPAEIYESEEYSTKAVLLWYATGDQVFLDAAKTILIDQMLPAYEEELTRNAYLRHVRLEVP